MLSPFIDSQSKDVMSYNHIEQDPDYEFTTEITVAIGAEHSQSMILKYNIGEQSIEYDDDDFEYGFVEIESYFSGVLVIDETVYNFEGYSEVKEGEEEFEIKAEIDSDNYVKMTLERDEGEIEYDYEISINGIVKKVSLEIEDDENQEFSIELEIEDDGVDSEFELKRELVDGVLITKVYYDVNGESGEMYVNETVDELGNKVIEYSIHPFNKQEKVIQREFRDIFGNTVS